MSTEELGLYIQIPLKISLEKSNGVATSTVGEVDNAVYFTWEQFVAGFRLPVPSLVKQFIHFTWAHPVVIHPNVVRILMGFSVLDSLYQLDISLEKIRFIYTLKLGTEGRLSMSAPSLRL